MSKSLIFLVSSFALMGLFLPSVSSAVAGIYTACPKGNISPDGECMVATVKVCYEGFVPCGLGKPYWKGADVTISNGKCQEGTKVTEGVSCQFCHFFVMINGIVNFILINVVPYLAVLMLVVGGIMFYLGGGKPDLLIRGKKLIYGVIIGLFLIYGSYLIVGTFLSALGVTDITLRSWAAQGAFSINCPIEI